MRIIAKIRIFRDKIWKPWMKDKVLSKVFAFFILILAIFVIGVKIHSILFFPKISDWNYHQIEKIDNEDIGNQFSFIVFADNKNSITTFNRIIKKVNKESAIFSIDVGDLAEDGTKEKLKFFVRQIEKINKPILTVVGNHELRDDGRANYYDFFGKFYYSFSAGSSYFIILDDANETRLDPWQFNWLKEELKRSQRYKYRFVFMHVPLYDPVKKKHLMYYGLKDRAFVKELNNLFDEYNVTMLFVSHVHGYFNGQWGKTPYIVTGGAGAELMGLDPQHYFYHYLRVDVSDNGVKYNIVKVKSPEFDMLDRAFHNIGIYVYAFLSLHFIDILIILTIIYIIFYAFFVEKWIVWRFRRKK